MSEVLTVLAPGWTTLQDTGRRRAGRVGQMTGGALDRFGAEVANALVASPPSAPLFELTALDFAVTTSTTTLVAITGATADVTVDGVRVPQWEPVVWPADTELAVTGIRDGLRVYVAVHGTIDVPLLLGSCAPDSVLGFGGRLSAGDRLGIDVDCPPIRHPHFDIPVFRVGAPRPDRRSAIAVTDGPDIAEFGDTASRLFETEWTVGPTSNHVGLRLAPAAGGTTPQRQVSHELLSRGVPVGAVEIPTGSSELLVLHRGRGVTAGYPVLAVVTTIGLDTLGQAAPGHTLTFVPVGVDAAVLAHRRRSRRLAQLRTRIDTVFASLGIPVHTGPADRRSTLTLESA